MPVQPGDPAALPLLREGELDVAGRIVGASNATLFGTITAAGADAECVYKPIRGERPLWDFPDGTLAGREVASYLVSEATGWSLIPPTVLRQGPFGPGMVQLWVSSDDKCDPVDVVPLDQVPRGWRTVLRAHDRFGQPALLVHADSADMRRMVVLDVLLNNADRKAGHLLPGPAGRIYGIDHGVCLHQEDKLRSVLWGFLDEPLPREALEAVEAVRARLDGELGAALGEHLTRREVRALRDRAGRLLDAGTYPTPGGGWPAIPWPPF